MENTKNPIVSIIITTYKRSDMLKRAIDSVLNQSYKKIEVIVVDDNEPSTQYRKETELILADYASNPKIKYIRHPKNMNGAAARNTGIRNSKGNYICFLDDDDWYLSDKVKEQVMYLLDNKKFDGVYCGWNRNNKEVIPTKEGDLTFGLLSGTHLVLTNTIMIKREAAILCGGWDERFQRNQEAAFLLRFFNHGYRLGVVKKVLVQFDTRDRSNVADPKENEENFNFYLKIHEKQIEACDKVYKNGKKIIYSYRYRGVLLNYIKCKEYLAAFRFYLRVIKFIPLRFNIDLLIYITKKIKDCTVRL
ncbi:glycosyltransferase family 2 protein [Virgibacillus pantothenticus]|nr:glycosyltransferase family A protein [Virgibacillus pantothenticus]QTY15215.1 glycosyltransferase family 2 protein [Virgibacillus pantothenticus]